LVLLMLLGGIGPEQVVQAMFIMAGTTLAAGSLGAVIALWRDRTFQSLALTVLFLVLYLLLVRGLEVLPRLPAGISAEQVQRVQQWLEPFRALESAHQPALPGETGLAPAYGFTLVMIGLAVLLNLYGLLRLRVWNPSGEPIIQREKPQDAA